MIFCSSDDDNFDSDDNDYLLNEHWGSISDESCSNESVVTKQTEGVKVSKKDTNSLNSLLTSIDGHSKVKSSGSYTENNFRSLINKQNISDIITPNKGNCSQHNYTSDECEVCCKETKSNQLYSNAVANHCSENKSSFGVFGRFGANSHTTWKHFQSYGKNYNVMNGAVVYKDEEVAKLEGIETIEYLESLYVEPKLDLGIHHIPPNEQFQYIYGSIYKIRGNDDAWLIKSDDRELRILTTFTIQSTICAALNSRKCLHWVFGVDSMGKVIGCPLSREQRDLFRQIFDFALDSEFVPSLDPSLVRLNFVGVEGRGDSQTSYLVEIVMNHKVTVLYQLSSGRIFYVENGRTKKMKSMDEARRMLLNRRQEDCTYIIKEMHKTGQLMYIPSITIYRSHLSSFFCGVTMAALVGIGLQRFSKLLISLPAYCYINIFQS